MIDENLLSRIQADFFDGNPVKTDTYLEGQAIDDNGDFILGCKAGPSYEIENLIHEMAHLADRSIPKLLTRPHNWGYYIGKPWSIAGNYGIEPTNSKGVLTELRCWAYQSQVMSHYGLNLDIDDLVASAVYLPSYWNFRCEFAAGRNDKTALTIAADKVRTLMETSHTLATFRQAWNQRMEAIAKHPFAIDRHLEQRSR